MTWQKKSAAPDFARFLDTLKADVTGGPEAWTLPFLNQLADYTIDVNAFCAAGPEECASLEALDFIGFLPKPGWLGAALTTLGMREKLACFGRNRMFGAWCENVVGAGTYSTDLAADPCTVAGPDNYFTAIRAIPAGSTHYRVTWSGVTTPDTGHRWSTRLRFYTTSGGSITFDSFTDPAFVPPVSGRVYGPGTIDASWHYYSCGLVAVDAGLVCGHVEADFDGGGTVPYTPPDLDQPDSAIPPAAGDYPDIASLGAKLDEIEEKLHNVIYGVTQLQAESFPVVHEPVTAPVDATNTTIDLDDDVIGVLVTVSDAAPFTDERFGVPFALHRLGRLVIGTVNGWAPSIDITVSPMLVWDLPPHPTQMAVYVAPPATATVQPLRRAPGPVG
jgi:hypothetical protein